MEGLEEIVKPDGHLTSAAAFVEGGIQDACDDACSICLEPFSDTDPSTLTNCKHEFHLQCVLEWCQRSSQCPMCWQSISMKDPTSQELLEAVEHERNASLNQSRNSAIFRHPTLGDFELQHLPVGLDDADLEERIMQHLAAAAAMGRRHMARREGHRNRSSGQGHPQFLVFSRHPNAPAAQFISESPTQRTEDETNAATNVTSPSLHPATAEEQSVQSNAPQSSGVQTGQASGSASGSSIYTSGQYENSPHNRSPIHSSPNSQDRAGPSEISTFSESIKSKLNAVSMRYKESISKSTRGWKERFFSRNTTMADLGSEVRKEVNAGLATVSRMMERLETRDSNRTDTSASNNMENSSMADADTRQVPEAGGGHSSISSSTANIQTSCAASGSN